MKLNSRKIAVALTLSLLTTQAYAEADDEMDMHADMEMGSHADDNKGWQILAGKNKGFVFEPTISLMLGAADATDIKGGTKLSWGLEMSFNCPLLQPPPSHKIRQQLSYFDYTDGNNTVQSFEINPHYIVDLSPDFWVGGGPGVGYVKAEVDGKTANMPAAQLGASFHYNIDSIFIGGEARYQVTKADDVGDKVDSGANNWRTTLKIGFNF